MASGTETRQRTCDVRIRLTPAEHARLSDAAASAGLSLGGYARRILLDAPPARQSRRPPVEKAELARILAAIGKIGSNVNQLARTWNAGGTVEADSVEEAARSIREIRDAVMAALGRG